MQDVWGRAWAHQALQGADERNGGEVQRQNKRYSGKNRFQGLEGAGGGIEAVFTITRYLGGYWEEVRGKR